MEETKSLKVTFSHPTDDNKSQKNANKTDNAQKIERQNVKPQQLIYNSMKRKSYSKHDLVKIKVHLEDHFYILSRFLICRIMTLIKVNF